jgi:hypothetical protein
VKNLLEGFRNRCGQVEERFHGGKDRAIGKTTESAEEEKGTETMGAWRY